MHVASVKCFLLSMFSGCFRLHIGCTWPCVIALTYQMTEIRLKKSPSLKTPGELARGIYQDPRVWRLNAAPRPNLLLSGCLDDRANWSWSCPRCWAQRCSSAAGSKNQTPASGLRASDLRSQQQSCSGWPSSGDTAQILSSAIAGERQLRIWGTLRNGYLGAP